MGGAQDDTDSAAAKTKAALHASEERYRALFERHPLPMWVYDVETLDFLEVNEAAVAHYGYSRAEFLTMTIADIRPAEDLPALHDSVRAGLPLTYEHAGIWRHQRKDGALIFVEITSNATDLFRGRPARVVAARNVTDRIQAERERATAVADREAALAENVRLMQAMAEAAEMQRQFLKDILASVTEGRLLLCDSRAELPSPPPLATGDPIDLTSHSLRALRDRTREAADQIDMPADRSHDLLTAASEAGMNAVVHGGGGIAYVGVDPKRGGVQVRIEDEGQGIALSELPRATLERGYTTAGTLGHGFFLILSCADRTTLLTGPQGTTIVLEQQRTPPLLSWLTNKR